MVLKKLQTVREAKWISAISKRKKCLQKLACLVGGFCWWARGRAGPKRVAKPPGKWGKSRDSRGEATSARFGPAFPPAHQQNPPAAQARKSWRWHLQFIQETEDKEGPFGVFNRAAAVLEMTQDMFDFLIQNFRFNGKVLFPKLLFSSHYSIQKWSLKTKCQWMFNRILPTNTIKIHVNQWGE